MFRARFTLLRRTDPLTEAHRALDGSPTGTPTDGFSEYHQVVDTLIGWDEVILAYHNSRRATNGPIESINNLHPRFYTE